MAARQTPKLNRQTSGLKQNISECGLKAYTLKAQLQRSAQRQATMERQLARETIISIAWTRHAQALWGTPQKGVACNPSSSIPVSTSSNSSVNAKTCNMPRATQGCSLILVCTGADDASNVCVAFPASHP